MTVISNIEYIREPTDLQCGQAVLAMLAKLSVQKVAEELNNYRETTLKEMKDFLSAHGLRMSDNRIQAESKAELPPVCVLSLETPRCWHWSLYFNGVFYDPEHGVMEDFPVCSRKYYWEVKSK